MKYSEIVQELINLIKNNNPNINIENSVLLDLFIKPISYQLSNLYNLCDSIKDLNLLNAYGENLTKIANFYGIQRKPATKSTVTVYIDLSALQFEDLIVQNGTIIKPDQVGIDNSFAVVGDYVFSVANRSQYEKLAQQIYPHLAKLKYNTTMVGAVTAQSILAGESQNVKPYTLKYISTKFPSKAININQAVGGSDEEDDESLRTRLMLYLSSIATTYGSIDSLLYKILSIDGVKKAFFIKSPHPLIKRDGSLYDENYNLIKKGNYNCSDVYIDGESIINKNYEFKYLPKNIIDIINFDNLIKLNFSIYNINSIKNITNDISYTFNMFTTDEYGNIFYDGNFVFINDYVADKVKIVENVVTKERKLAYYLSDNSNYIVIDKLNSSKYSGIDNINYLLLINDKIDIYKDRVIKQKDDTLKYENIIDVYNVYDNNEIKITYKVEFVEEYQGGFVINLNRDDVVSVSNVLNLSTNYKYNYEYNDKKIILKTPIPPKIGDILEISANIENTYIKNINYSIIGNKISWTNQQIKSIDIELQKENNINALSDYSKIEVSADVINENEVIEVEIDGDIISVDEYRVQKIKDREYTFGIQYDKSILDVLEVNNLTKKYKYNLSKYYLSNNSQNPSVFLDYGLLKSHFKLDKYINTNYISVGDNICFGIFGQKYSYYTKDNFENNLYGFSKPIYDIYSFNISDYHISLKDKKDLLTQKTLYGLITRDLTLDGVVEIIDDLIIDNNVTLSIEPNTIIKIKPKDEKYRKTIAFNIVFSDLYDNISNAYEKHYIIYSDTINADKIPLYYENGSLYIKPNKDILIIKNNSYYINNQIIDDGAVVEIEKIINNNHPIFKVKLISYDYLESDGPVRCLVRHGGKYYYYFDRKEDEIDNDSINIFFVEDSFVYINDFYLNNKILVINDSENIYHDSLYRIQYDVFVSKGINIIVNGMLKIKATNIYESVLITSSSKNPRKGDWGGIIYTYRSNSKFNDFEIQNTLEYVRIEYAETGVYIQDSDVIVQNCIFYNCLDSCVRIKSEVINFQKQTINFVISKNNFVSDSHVDYTSDDLLKVYKYEINDNIFTKNNLIPKIRRRISDSIYEIDLIPDLDIECYINDNKVNNIDIVDNNGIVYSDGIVDYSLQYGIDYVIEYHTDNKYYLCFRYTDTNKLTKIRNILDILENNNITCIVTFKYYSNVKSSMLYNNIMYHSNVGILCDSSIISVLSNTIDCAIGCVISNSYGNIRGNIFTYDVTPITLERNSICIINRNNFYNYNIKKYYFKPIDCLLKQVSKKDEVLKVNGYLYKPNDLISVNNEEMRVKYIIDNDVYVERGINGVIETHNDCDIVNIGHKILHIMYIGVECDKCDLIITDKYGNNIKNTYSMKKIYKNTYYTQIFAEQSFYFRFLYVKDGNYRYSDIQIYEANKLNENMYIVFKTLPHEKKYYQKDNYNNENMFVDPNFRGKDFYDYRLMYNSYCYYRNTIYSSHILQNEYHRYINYIDVEYSVSLPINNNRIPIISNTPLIYNNINEIEIIGVDFNNYNYRLNISEITLFPDEYESNLGYIGAIIVNNLTSDKYGRYIVRYKTATSLGSDLDSYYIFDTILYKIKSDKDVSFDKITFASSNGGEILFGFYVAKNEEEDWSINEYIYPNNNEVNIGNYINNNGKILYLSIKLKGNDRSYNKYPILNNFTVHTGNYIDSNNIYTVISLVNKDNKTILSLNKPINNNTYNNFANQNNIGVYVVKNNEYYLLSKTKILQYSSTVELDDNVTTIKYDADVDDIVVAKLITVKRNKEKVLLTNTNNKQITNNKYYYIKSLINKIYENYNESYNYENKKLTLSFLDQPRQNNIYNVDYKIRAASYGDVISINYNENSLLSLVNNTIEENKPIFSDIIVKPIFNVDIIIEAYIYYNKKINKEFIFNNIFETINEQLKEINNSNIDIFKQISSSEIKSELVYDGVTNIDLKIYKFGEDYNGDYVYIYANEKAILSVDNLKVNFIGID